MKLLLKPLEFCPPTHSHYDYTENQSTHAQETRSQPDCRAHRGPSRRHRTSERREAVRQPGQEGQGPQEAQIRAAMTPAERLAVIRAKVGRTATSAVIVPTGLHQAANQLPARPKHPYSPPNVTPNGPRYSMVGPTTDPKEHRFEGDYRAAGTCWLPSSESAGEGRTVALYSDIMGRRSTKIDTGLILLLIVIGLPIYLFKKTSENFGAPTTAAGIIGAIALVFIIRALSRARRKASLFAKYGDAELVDRIINKVVWVGETQAQLSESLGSPADTDEKVLKTKTKVIWKYHHQGGNRYGLRITVENGEVVGWDEKL